MWKMPHVSLRQPSRNRLQYKSSWLIVQIGKKFAKGFVCWILPLVQSWLEGLKS